MIARALATDGDTIAFAHGHILRILGARWIGQPPEFAASLGLHTAALCELGYMREHRVDLALERHRPPAVTAGR